VLSVFGVAPHRIGGTETFARELSLQLDKAGRNSILCFLDKPTAEVADFLALPNVSLDLLSNSTNFSVATTQKLAAILKQWRPEILHLHFTGFLGSYPWLARARSVRKVFFTDHSSRPAAHQIEEAPLWKKLLARTINRHLTKVICVSQYGYRCMTGLNLLPPDRFKMIYNGVDLTRVVESSYRAVDFRQRYAIPSDRSIVVQVSWIIPEKGIPELLQTARAVLTQTKQVHFVIVGEGEYRSAYMTQAQELGIEDFITWTGMIKDPFGEGVFDAADVVCQFSNWEEVFGWMIAEAMAYQKPVVATRVGGIPELIRDSISGFLVERGDIQAAADKIILLLSNPALRKKMGVAGSETVKEKFELRKNVTQLVELYELN
jgi:glycosyltransferase involved in cell wall biosynthesis